MRGLFVTEYMLVGPSGHKQMAAAYLECVRQLVGKENLDIVAIKNTQQKAVIGYDCVDRNSDILDIFTGYTAVAGRRVCKYILQRIVETDYDFIFFTNNWSYGKTIKKIKEKKKSLKIIVYFTGVFRSNFMAYLSRKKDIKRFILAVSQLRSEALAVKYADVKILLNQRDQDHMRQYYNCDADLLIPIFFVDSYKESRQENIEMDGFKHKCLFVGGFFEPNVHGLKWFVSKVMPLLDKNIELFVVGNGMEQTKKDLINSHVHIYGRVEDLSEWYNNADLVVAPIWHGDGMKTKTAEALMYGKDIVASEEALRGYDISIIPCRNEVEFATSINNYFAEEHSRFNEANRTAYLENYSVEAAAKKLKSVIGI